MYSHRDLCHLTAAWMLRQQRIKLVCWELRQGRGVVDAIGVDPRGRRIIACEVKRTRSDMLADLRARKMLKYELTSTHCYLAAAVECFRGSALEELAELELPPHWGVLLINPDGEIRCIRSARAHRQIREPTISKLIYKIGRAHMYRHIALLGIAIS